MVGSANMARNPRNPFTFDERKAMLRSAYAYEIAEGRLIVEPLDDHPYSDTAWVTEVQRRVNAIVLYKGNHGGFQNAGIKDFSDPRFDKYSQRLARVRSIKKYIYRMDVLERTLSYAEVTEIFVRVNSLGAKLRSSDLALAQITAKWRGALKTFQSFQSQYANEGMDLELGVFLRSLVAFITNQSRFITVNSIGVDKLKSGWGESVKGMEFASNFMRNNAKIDSPALMSSSSIMVALAMYGHRRDFQFSKEEAEQLRRWALLANVKGRYSRGSSETILDQDLAIIRDGGGAADLIEKLRQQVGLLDVSPEELEGRNQRSALFKTMFMAFRAAGAKDWKSNLSIAFDHSGVQHKLHAVGHHRQVALLCAVRPGSHQAY
jgi:hypothetical protein